MESQVMNYLESFHVDILLLEFPHYLPYVREVGTARYLHRIHTVIVFNKWICTSFKKSLQSSRLSKKYRFH